MLVICCWLRSEISFPSFKGHLINAVKSPDIKMAKELYGIFTDTQSATWVLSQLAADTEKQLEKV